jgi:RNA polymerase sigma-70 factor (ECF subfamily)
MPSSSASALAAGLVDRHGASIRQYIRRTTRDGQDRDDLVQEVFLHLLRGAASYDPRERERAWVFRIARNVVVDAHRRARRSREDAVAVEPTTGPSQSVAAALQIALTRLPAEEREAFLLGEVAGLTYAEIAATTSSTIAAVRSRIYRARLTLRGSLAAPPRLGVTAFARKDQDD